MKPNDWSETDCEMLRSLMASESWSPVKRMLDHTRDLCLTAYHEAQRDHLYYQGLLHGVVRVIRSLEEGAKPVVKLEDQIAPPGFGIAGRRLDVPTDY